MQPFGYEPGHINEHVPEPLTADEMNTLRDAFYVLHLVLRQNLYGWYAILLLLVFALLA